MGYVQTLTIICPLLFLAGFVDSIAGGGGLVSTPAYLAAGIPPHNVLGCNKFSAVFGATSSLYRFASRKHIHAKTAVFSIFSALVGSACGAKLVLEVDDGVLKLLMICLLPVIVVFVFLKKDFGEEGTLLPDRSLVIYSMIISFLLGMYDGFFGPGTGTFLILAFTSILGFDILTASGNAKAVNWASNIAALAVFLINGKVIFQYAIPAALCNMAGGYLGAGLAIRNGTKIIKPVFLIVIIFLMAKIIYDIS